MHSFRAQAVIFDLDGVLIDSEPLHQEALNRVLATEGIEPLEENEYRKLIGTMEEDTWKAIAAMRLLSASLDHYVDMYNATLIGDRKDRVDLQPGAAAIIKAAQARGLPIGVASSSRRSWVDADLKAIGLESAFDVVITGDEIKRGKPAPDIYLEGAQRLGVSPEKCLAIEDSPTGVAAAADAGMYTVAVRTDATAGLDLSRADAIVDNLEQFDMNLLGSADLSQDEELTAEAR